MQTFFKGILIGLSIAAPVGPIGMLCIQRTLNFGWRTGFLSGLGAAIADSIYGTIAAFGLGIVIQFFRTQETWLRLFGGAFLIYLGISGLFKKSPSVQAPILPDRRFVVFFSTLLLTLANPSTILSFIGIFAGLGINPGNQVSAATMVAGVFCGSAVWWLFLCATVGIAQHRLSPTAIAWISRFSSIIMLGFGFMALFAWNTSGGRVSP